MAQNSSGFITSHEEFNFGRSMYNSMKDYSLTLNIPLLAVKIRLQFIYFNIGNEFVSNCTKTGIKNSAALSQFTIRNSNVYLYGCGGGKATPDATEFGLTSNENKVQFRLQTNQQDSLYGGYLVFYESK